MGAVSLKPRTVAVTPVMSVVLEVDVGPSEVVSIQVENLSSETFTGIIRRSNDTGNAMSPTTMPDLRSIPPAGTLGPDGEDLSSVVVDCLVPANSKLDVIGKMTGAGGNVRVTALSRRSGAQRPFYSL